MLTIKTGVERREMNNTIVKDFKMLKIENE
jgi:hypothetical protein